MDRSNLKRSLAKSPEEIETLALGGKILAAVLREVSKRVAPGVSTLELEEAAEKEIRGAGAEPSFKGYGLPTRPYPAALCTSVNDVVVHGIPSRGQILREGDIIGLDCGVYYRGLYTDAAVTVPVGRVSPLASRLIAATEQALREAVSVCVLGRTVGDISHAVQSVAESAGFAVVRELVGHGVGYKVHEPPEVPCFGSRGTGLALQEGMVLAIEPMVNAGGFRVTFDEDGWTVRTADGSLSAHFEHTVAVTRAGPVVLTG